MAQPRRVLRGPGGIVAFLRRKWARELDYRLEKHLWCFTENRIAVRFEYESRDAGGQWWRSHGNELWEFEVNGLWGGATPPSTTTRSKSPSGASSSGLPARLRGVCSGPRGELW